MGLWQGLPRPDAVEARKQGVRWHHESSQAKRDPALACLGTAKSKRWQRCANAQRYSALGSPTQRCCSHDGYRVHTSRSRANWERSPPATSGHSTLHLSTVLGPICHCGMARFSAVPSDPQVTSEHAWGLAFLRPRMQWGHRAALKLGLYANGPYE